MHAVKDHTKGALKVPAHGLCTSSSCNVIFRILAASIQYSYMVGIKKKFPFTVRTTGRVIPLFLFNFRAVAVLVHFQTVPVLSEGQPVRSGERPGRRN